MIARRADILQDNTLLLLNCSLVVCVMLFMVSIALLILWLVTRRDLADSKDEVENYRDMYYELKDLVDNHECCTCGVQTEGPQGPPPYPEEVEEDEEDWWREGNNKPYGEAS